MLLIILYVVLTIAAIIGIGYLAGWLSTKTKKEQINLALQLINEATYNAVATVMSTFVDGIKEGRSDGKLTVEEAKEAFERAKKAAINIVGPKIINLAKKLGVEVEAYINNLIERAVKELKR